MHKPKTSLGKLYRRPAIPPCQNGQVHCCHLPHLGLGGSLAGSTALPQRLQLAKWLLFEHWRLPMRHWLPRRGLLYQYVCNVLICIQNTRIRFQMLFKRLARAARCDHPLAFGGLAESRPPHWRSGSICLPFCISRCRCGLEGLNSSLAAYTRPRKEKFFAEREERIERLLEFPELSLFFVESGPASRSFHAIMPPSEFACTEC